MRRNKPGITGSGTLSHLGKFAAVTLPACKVTKDLHSFAKAPIATFRIADSLREDKMSQRSNRRARLLSGAAVGAVTLLACNIANAQSTSPGQVDPDATQVEEIVVTGIRAAVEASISAKARNTSIVEVISAEDIGKLPDVSIAESLARLPGLTSQRADGRSQLISIRGLGPDFTTALLNGREQVTTGDNRGVEFDQFPSELLSGVTVYKTPDAALVGQGLAGTVDMQTIRPLEYGRRAVAVNLRGEWNDAGALNAGGTDQGERFSVTYIDQFANDTIGVALGYAHTGSPYQAEQYRTWGPNYPTTPDDALVPGGVVARVMSGDLQRDAVMGTVEYRPNDRLTSTFDAFYSKFDNEQIVRGMEIPTYWGGGVTLEPGYTVEDGLVTSGTFSNVKPILLGHQFDRSADLYSLGWNNRYQLTDNWAVELDLAWSKAEREDYLLETNAGTGRNAVGARDTFNFDLGPDGPATFDVGLDYADPATIFLTSPQGWGGVPGGQDGYLNMPSIDDELKSARLDFEGAVDAGPISTIQVGLYATDREKSLTKEEYYLSLTASPGSVAVPAEFLMEPTSLDFVGIDGVLSYDARGLVDSGIYNLIRNLDAGVIANEWEVREKITTAYIKAGLDTRIGSIPLTGNFGFQVMHTDQSSSGGAASGAVVTPVTDGDDYFEILPSANLIFEVQPDTYVRVAAARTVARPRMDQMRASRTYGFDVSKNIPGATLATSPWSGSGGNPDLKPWVANVFDVSLEKYFANRRGYVSLAGFYKDLETYIYDQSVVGDFTGFPTGTTPPVTPTINQGFITTPENGEGGYIQGVEFAVSAPFDIFHPVLDGFGGQFSISQTESDIETSPGNSTPIPGLSETVASATLYYENAGFQARISSRYRSEFLGEVRGYGANPEFQTVSDENVIDAQVGYEFQGGMLEGVSVLAQVNNLTDEEFTTHYQGDERQTAAWQRYGRTFLVGVNYRF